MLSDDRSGRKVVDENVARCAAHSLTVPSNSIGAYCNLLDKRLPIELVNALYVEVAHVDTQSSVADEHAWSTPLINGCPHIVIRVPHDGGFATPEVLDYLDEAQVEYVVVIRGNSTPRAHTESLMSAVRRRSISIVATEHDYVKCECAAASWNANRRVIIKAGAVRLSRQSPKDNTRLVVTNLKQTPRFVSEPVYCQRGSIENRISSCCTVWQSTEPAAIASSPTSSSC